MEVNQEELDAIRLGTNRKVLRCGNLNVIEHPNGGTSPIKPKKSMIFLVAFVLGLLIPIAIIFLREQMNTSLRGRDDLKNVKVPFIAEIPLTGNNPPSFFKARIEEREQR